MINQDENESGVSFVLELFMVLLRRWWIIALVTLLSTAAGVMYAINAPRIYQVQVLIAPESDESGGQGGGALARIASQFGNLASLAGVGFGEAGNSKEIAIATLTSLKFQTKIIQDLGLMREFFRDRWDEKASGYRPSWTGAVPTVDDAIKYFNDQVFTVIQDRKTGLIKLQIVWRDRVKAASWANEIVLRINQLMREQAIEESRRSMEFLNQELTRTSNLQVQQSIYGLIQSQVNRIMVANVREQYAFRIIDPAVAPGERNSIRPKRMVIAIASFAFGLIFSSAFMIVIAMYGKKR